MKSYITNANARRLASKLSLSEIDIDQEIFHTEFKWFSQNEKKSLLAFKLLYENPEEFLKRYKKSELKNKREILFDPQCPVYHKNSNCKLLLSRYNNYKIPEKIKGRWDTQGFRKRIRWSHDIEDIKLTRFLKMVYNIKSEDFRDLYIEEIEKLKLDDLDDKIQEFIDDANKYYIKANKKTKTIIDYFGQDSFRYMTDTEINRNNTEYCNEDILEVLKEFNDDYKLPIITYLKEYYRTKYNPELKIETKLLKQLGFAPCINCCDIEYIRNLNLKYEQDESKDIDSVVLLRLYEDDSFIIFSFIHRLDLGIIKYYHNLFTSFCKEVEFVNLFDEALKNGKVVIDFVNICETYDFFEMLDFQIADLLGYGECKIFNKETNQFAVNITVKYFNDICCLAGSKGRIFFADGQELFKVTDALS